MGFAVAENQEFTLPPLEERPLVTFALFAYNQEKYIREAVEGAFAQTYEPLEIILSDDCSTDRTFEIIEEMAAGYVGPHKIKINRNIVNLGTALHVQVVFSQSRGALFVVAAGDDISLPDRTKTLFERWKEENFSISTIYSRHYSFDERRPFEKKVAELKTNALGANQYTLFLNSRFVQPAAPTCAYSREILELFPTLLGGSVIEDTPLFFRTCLIGNFLCVDEPLVLQRRHEENSGTGFTLENTPKWNRFTQSRIIALRTMQRDLSSKSIKINLKERSMLEKAFLKRIKKASSLILPETRRPDLIEMMKFIFHTLIMSSVPGGLMDRIKFCYLFFMLDKLKIHKYLSQIYRKK